MIENNDIGSFQHNQLLAVLPSMSSKNRETKIQGLLFLIAAGGSFPYS
jgi:hypothetical protein